MGATAATPRRPGAGGAPASTPVELAAKEGLALINGTDGMLGMLVLACEDLSRLLKAADVAAAMTVEALLGTDRVFAADLQALRPHPGQAASAANLLRLLAESADRGLAPRRRHPGAGRLFAALRAAGRRGGAGHPGARRARGRPRAARRDRQPGRAAGRAGGVQRQLPRRPGRLRAATSSPSPSPTWPRSPSAAPTGCSTRRARTACRRSSPTTRASTPGS